MPEWGQGPDHSCMMRLNGRGTVPIALLEPLAAGCRVTRRQQEVLGLVARGYTNARIGEELGITLNGAKWHVGEALGALGLSSRVEAGRWWRTTESPRAA